MVVKYKSKIFVLKSFCVVSAMFFLRTRIVAVLKNDIDSTETSSHELLLLESSARNFITCEDKGHDSKVFQNGIYWMFKNYVKSKYFKCGESITYTTPTDFSYLDNLVPLLERWQGPISIALWAPGSLFNKTLDSIAYLRNCHENRELVRNFSTFHIFFERQHFPGFIPSTFDEFEQTYKCPTAEPFVNNSAVNLFKQTFNATFPINVGRNLARESALTHFVFATDFELYPSPGLINQFFAMISKDPKPYLEKKNVFVIPIFEVQSDQKIPQTKSDLAAMIKNKTSIWFHYDFCRGCHLIPKYDKWFSDINDTEMSVFQSVKRQARHSFWEPMYIGTNHEPLWDERLDWEGKSDKMTQAYMMCLLDYNYNVLSNGFLCHKPGIKVKAWVKANVNPIYTRRTVKLLNNEIKKEIKLFYNDRDGCSIQTSVNRGVPVVPGDFPSHLISFKDEKTK